MELGAMKVEQNRRLSFILRNNRSANPDLLAKEGFYAVSGMKMECYFCGLEMYVGDTWLIEEMLPEHKFWSPHCPLILGITTNNVPIVEGNQPQAVPMTIKHAPEPMFLEYVDKTSRMMSYELYMPEIRPTPAQLSEAGLFFSPSEDCSLCFWCGCSFAVQNWAPFDDPWEYHAIANNKCQFLLKQKGQLFVDQVSP